MGRHEAYSKAFLLDQDKRMEIMMIYPYKKKEHFIPEGKLAKIIFKQEIRGKKKKNQGFFQIRINCGKTDRYEHNLMASVHLHMCCQWQKSGVYIFFLYFREPYAV